MKDVKIAGHVRHDRLYFSPAPKNPSFGTTPVIFKSRRISDITHEDLPKHEGRDLPTNVRYIFFDQSVEVQFAEKVSAHARGSCTSLAIEELNRETYHVCWSTVDAEKLRESWIEVKVHPSLQGKMWAFAADGAEESEIIGRPPRRQNSARPVTPGVKTGAGGHTHL